MCGLVGIAGDLAFKDEATMKRLLLLDYFRGPDSTGFASVRNSGDVHVAKIASHPLDLFDMTRFKSALSGAASNTFIGHNRAATRGAVNAVNAHPFQYEHIVGAHNGTLDYQSVQRLESAIDEKFSVDSQALFAAIAKLGIEEAISLCEEGKDASTGAWSLVWFDSERKSLNFLRNKHRPLWYALSKNFNRLYWASEWRMIDAALNMAAVPDELHVETKFSYWATEENVHYEYDIEALKKGGDTRIKPKARIIKGREPAPAHAASSSPFHRTTSGSGTTQTTTSTGTTPSTTKSSGDEFIHLEGDALDPFAGLVTEEKFKSMTTHGCCYCGAPISFGETGLTIFDVDDRVLCNDCSGHSASHNRIHMSPTEFVKVK